VSRVFLTVRLQPASDAPGALQKGDGHVGRSRPGQIPGGGQTGDSATNDGNVCPWGHELRLKAFGLRRRRGEEARRRKEERKEGEARVEECVGVWE